MKTFRQYIMEQEVTDDPEGDFISDTQRVMALEENVRPGATPFPSKGGWRAVKSFLEFRGACEEAIEAGKIVWDRYKKG